ncbi:MAG: mannose-1-phosphate guanylyltransferase [Treponema sp.]|jgi:mannose-1-phosphate guanylyltransferase/mannose-1-phosphate guanylyltransferase/mannose-6-phosphate isomerase|nr:mannose-1-phosphate guanylyltransferase [Treponema sp.]
MFDDCIIMAGGSGTRLWPASNSRRPKQFLPVSAADPARTFFSGALERALALTGGRTASQAGGPAPAGRVIIIAGKGHVSRIVSACTLFDQKDRDRMLLIVEPEAKNTAPAIACGARFAEIVPDPAAAADQAPCSRSRAILVLTSDHIIEPLGIFLEDAAVAAALAGQNRLVVFGIVPGRPETGYGYIEAGEVLAAATPANTGEAGAEARVALSFREKPDRLLAEEYCAAGRFYWNSGMFAFSSSFILDEFRRHAPQVLAPFMELEVPAPAAYRTEQGLRILDRWPGFAEAYARTDAVSIDYAIAEHCQSVALVSAHFSWTDIGNWDEYAKLLSGAGTAGARVAAAGADTAETDTAKADAAGLEVYRAGAENCFVDSDIPVALCGVEDLIISVRSGKDGGAPLVFVAKKGKTQQVREIVEQIRAAGRTTLL